MSCQWIGYQFAQLYCAVGWTRSQAGREYEEDDSASEREEVEIMKNYLAIATLSLGTLALMQPCFAQSYDALHAAQQKEIMRTWNVVGTAQPFLTSYDELRSAQQQKINRTWNAIEVVRGAKATAVPTKDYLDQNIEQINMNAAIKSANEGGN